MKCEDLMSMELQWVSSTATAEQAAQAMRDRSMGLLVVLDTEQKAMVGVITDRDIALRVCAENKPAASTPVGDICTKDVVTCYASDPISEAEKKMAAEEKSRIVIVNESERPVGIVSLTDILSRDGKRRAIKTARAVLAREAGGPHQPIESIHLTASTLEDERRAARQQTYHPGVWTGSMREFPI